VYWLWAVPVNHTRESAQNRSRASFGQLPAGRLPAESMIVSGSHRTPLQRIPIAHINAPACRAASRGGYRVIPFDPASSQRSRHAEIAGLSREVSAARHRVQHPRSTDTRLAARVADAGVRDERKRRGIHERPTRGPARGPRLTEPGIASQQHLSEGRLRCLEPRSSPRKELWDAKSLKLRPMRRRASALRYGRSRAG